MHLRQMREPEKLIRTEAFVIVMLCAALRNMANIKLGIFKLPTQALPLACTCLVSPLTTLEMPSTKVESEPAVSHRVWE